MALYLGYFELIHLFEGGGLGLEYFQADRVLIFYYIALGTSLVRSYR